MFQLIFRGECQPGTDVQTARNNARTLFKASPDQIGKMFSGRPVVIRNRLEQDQAEKYRAVLARHGMLAYVEPMAAPDRDAGEPAAPAEPAAAPAAPQPGAAGAEPPAPPVGGGSGIRTEPGDRLPLAGEKVDTILAGSRLTLDPAGTRLANEQQTPEPVFDALDDWTLAPAGADLGVTRESPPPIVPDVSHLSLEDVPEAGEH